MKNCLSIILRNHRRDFHGSPKKSEAPKCVLAKKRESENQITGSLNGKRFRGQILEVSPPEPDLKPSTSKITQRFIDSEAVERNEPDTDNDDDDEDDFGKQFK